MLKDFAIVGYRMYKMDLNEGENKMAESTPSSFATMLNYITMFKTHLTNALVKLLI